MKRIKYFLLAILVGFGLVRVPTESTRATENCPELRIVFARGSGGERWNDQNYLAFKSGIESYLVDTGISYEFLDLDYPAIGIGELSVLLGAYVGGGEAYAFGDSVNAGVTELTRVVNEECPNSKYVLGGYSQGAMATSKALRYLNADKVIYAATFGDPKIYLPEGAGVFPAACQNIGLSDYREYVPDCYAHLGLLGTYNPYRPENFIGKYGTWCNTYDIFCSSYLGISSHTSYVSDDLYADAGEKIFEKIREAFNIPEEPKVEYDVVILTNGNGLISNKWDYYSKVRSLALDTVNAGGRAAVYYFRDNDDGTYKYGELCDFEGCDDAYEIQEVASSLPGASLTNESSALSAILKTMNEVGWRDEARKAIVVLSGNVFADPAKDGVGIDDVVRVGAERGISLYAISGTYDVSGMGNISESMTKFKNLTDLTGGITIGLNQSSALILDQILDREPEGIIPFSLEESETMSLEVEAVDDALPMIETIEVQEIDTSTVKIKFKNTGTRTFAALNDGILGIFEGEEITISGLNRRIENTIILSPLSETRRGRAVEIKIDRLLPKAPNTGRAN